MRTTKYTVNNSRKRRKHGKQVDMSGPPVFGLSCHVLKCKVPLKSNQGLRGRRQSLPGDIDSDAITELEII